MSVHSLFATCPRALEDLLCVELGAFGAAGIKERVSGALFNATLETAYRACLWSRVGSRVLLPLATFQAETTDDLRERVRAMPWTDHLDVSGTFAVDCTISGPPDAVPQSLANSRYAALVVKDGIADHFTAKFGKRPDVRVERPALQVNVHLQRESVTVGIDLTGESLHRRSYRRKGVEAPLKENVAAGMLLRSGWEKIAREGGALVDPMCGSGTLLIEGAMIALDIAPGMLRDYYGFLGWKGHDERLWKRLLAEAKARAAAAAPRGGVRGFDRDPRAVEAALENIHAAGLSDRISVTRCELADIRPPEPPDVGREGVGRESARGLVAVNPPYGERLGEEAELHGLYQLLGRVLHERFPGWKAAVLTGNPLLSKSVGLRAAKVNTLYNGPIKCTLALFDLVSGMRFLATDAPLALPAEAIRPAREPVRTRTGAPAPAPRLVGPRRAPLSADQPLPPVPESELARRAEAVAAEPNIAMFANRVEKNRKYIGKLMRREGVSCYRLYDADLPEYAVALDVYEERWLHVQEYVAPGYIDPTKTERRLDAVMGVLPETLGVPPENIFLKKRRRHKRTEQYGKLDDSGRFFIVHEADNAFLVNFTDYLDTGIFLDHRLTRRLIRDEAKGTDFLNLYSYTCTATVYAAKGGARSTTSIDSSNTYLRWGRENLDLNGVSGQQHVLQRADCTEWLRSDKRKYGLIFMDPPTFSNAKDKRPTLDVQRDHVKLIKLAAARLAPGGLLLFSTNFKRFELDREALSGFAIEDVSAATTPRDFARTPRVHHCLRIAARPPVGSGGPRPEALRQEATGSAPAGG